MTRLQPYIEPVIEPRQRLIDGIALLDKLIPMARSVLVQAQEKVDRMTRERDRVAGDLWRLDHEAEVKPTMEG